MADDEVYQPKIILLIGIVFLVLEIQKKSIRVKLKKDLISSSKRNGVMEKIQQRKGSLIKLNIP